MENNNQRRAFIHKGLKSLSKLLVENEIPVEFNSETEKIKMLTPDGKLVEVDTNAVKSRYKTSNKDILHWMNQKKSDPVDKK